MGDPGVYAFVAMVGDGFQDRTRRGRFIDHLLGLRKMVSGPAEVQTRGRGCGLAQVRERNKGAGNTSFRHALRASFPLVQIRSWFSSLQWVMRVELSVNAGQQSVALDGPGITVLRDIRFFAAGPQVNAIVRLR